MEVVVAGRRLKLRGEDRSPGAVPRWLGRTTESRRLVDDACSTGIVPGCVTTHVHVLPDGSVLFVTVARDPGWHEHVLFDRRALQARVHPRAVLDDEDASRLAAVVAALQPPADPARSDHDEARAGPPPLAVQLVDALVDTPAGPPAPGAAATGVLVLA